ncbi:MAG: PilC/PilY family type IV pilus protein [Pseudomonas sp.]
MRPIEYIGRFPLPLRRGGYVAAALALLAVLVLLIRPVIADTTSTGLDIPDEPLITDAQVAPNVLFILDDSYSMAYNYLNNLDLDEILGNSGSGFTSEPACDADGCSGLSSGPSASGSSYMYDQTYVTNTLYYNPTISYTPWLDQDGNELSGGTTYTAACSDDALSTSASSGYSGTDGTCASTTSLLTSTKTFYVPKCVDTSSGSTSSCLATSTTAGKTYYANAANYYRYQILTSGAIYRSEYLTYTSSNTSSSNSSSSTSSNCSSGQVGGWQTGGSSQNCSSSSSSSSSSTSSTTGCDTTTSGYGWRNCTEATPTGRTEAKEMVNFATWYSWHRTRMKAAKAAASSAFNDLGDSANVRVGFRTISGNKSSYVSSSNNLLSSAAAVTAVQNIPTQAMPIPVTFNNGLFLDTTTDEGTFTNRKQWFKRLFQVEAVNVTPLHSALKLAGDYFSGDSQYGAYGPQSSSEQYACRQNFAILTTDGHWDSLYEFKNGSQTSTAISVGNQDNSSGSTITNDDTGDSYAYTPTSPYSDSYSNTLADVAMKYWKSDLRTDLDNVVPTNDDDPAFWQHMVTFGISLGVKGNTGYTSVDEVLAAGSVSWPDPTDAKDDDRVDDLLHAAVNGHGTFLSASNPDEFASGLSAALSAVTARTGSFSNVVAESTSVSSDNYLFVANYISGVWSGQLYACAASESSCSSSNAEWKATTQLASQYDGTSSTSIASRGIYTWDGSAGASFPTTAQKSTLGEAITNYLRGDQTNEIQNGGSYRNRSTVLGDIADSSPTYVSATDTVYVGANDGMLHAFNAATGVELFAYVPAAVVGDDLATLADSDYSHKYFVDGPIAVSTTAQTTKKNVLVGALGRGGKGLYALNVTSPTSFSASDVLWEVTETTGTTGNMGKILGQPFIAKLNNGVTALVTGNGVNSSNGHAVLLVYNVLTGALIKQIDTGVGGTTSATTNGLFAPTGWDEDGSGTVDYVYAGDLQGNVWKFDLSSTSTGSWALGNSSKPLFTATYTSDGTSTTQPITSGVLVAEKSSSGDTWVFVGTGKYLETADITDTSVQTMYGFIDASEDSSGTTLTPSDLTSRAMYETTSSSTSETVRSFESSSALDTDTEGWYINLVVDGGTAEGERVVTTPQSYGSYLIFSSITPSESSGCSSSGSSWIYALDMFTGTSSSTSYFDLDGDGDTSDDTTALGTAVGGKSISSGMASVAALLNGKLVVGDSSGSTTSVTTTSVTSTRVSWREIRKED